MCSITKSKTHVIVCEPLEPIKLEKSNDVLKLLEDTMNSVRAGKMDVRAGIGHLCGQTLKTFEIIIFDERLVQLEKKIYAKPGIDSVNVTARVENSNQHELLLIAEINNMDDVTIDSLNLFDDGMHGDSVANDNLWGNFYLPTDEQLFKFSVTTNNISEETSRTLPNVAWFTTIGPIVYKGRSPFIIDDSIPNPGDIIGFKLHLKNEGLVSTAKDIKAQIYSTDPKITVHNFYSAYGDIGAGNTVESSQGYSFQISSDIASDTTIYLSIFISSGDYHFWSDSMAIPVVTGISEEDQRYQRLTRLNRIIPILSILKQL